MARCNDRSRLKFSLARALAVLAAAALSWQASTQAQDAASAPTNSAASAAVPASRHAPNLAIITIEGVIDSVTSKSFERRLKKAVEGGADGIVIEINSPGGMVGAVLEITSMIKQCPIQNITAWVNPNAYSGGAIIALACNRIIVSPGATMGDAAPIMISPTGNLVPLPETERMKMLAPLLAELVDSARRSGYDEMLVQGFVALGVELWLIRDKQTGERYFVTEDEYREIFGTEPTRGRPHVASGAGLARSGIPLAGGPPAPKSSGDFTPAINGFSEDDLESIDLALKSRSNRPSFTSEFRNRFEFVHYATDGNTLLTLKEQDLKDYGFADPTVSPRTDADIQAYLGSTNVRRLDRTWSEQFVRFMTQGMSGLVVRGLLVVVFLLAMFIEMVAPGVGLGGAVALAALAGLIVPPMLIGAASWWSLAAIVSGVGLIMVEIFIAPGFGVPGVLGLLSLFAGLVGTLGQVGELFPGSGTGEATDLAWAVSVVLLAMFAAGVGMFFFSKYTSQFPLLGKLVLTSEPSSQGGMLSAMGAAPTVGPVEVGAVGRAITPLRPSGQADFDGSIIDVVAEYGYVEGGSVVRAVSVSSFRVSVELDAGDRDAADPAGEDGLSQERHS